MSSLPLFDVINRCSLEKKEANIFVFRIPPCFLWRRIVILEIFVFFYLRMDENRAQRISHVVRFRPRALLTEIQAIEIYKCRRNKMATESISMSTATLAKKYAVSPKTIRDIWNRRTWTQETRHLWTDDEHAMIRCARSKKELCMDQINNNAESCSSNTSGNSDSSQVYFEILDSYPYTSAELPRPFFGHLHSLRQPPIPILDGARPPPAPASCTVGPGSNPSPSCCCEQPFGAPEGLGPGDDPFHLDWPHW